MTDALLETSLTKTVTRRAFVLAGLVALIAVSPATPAFAERNRRRRNRRRRRILRRRAIRRVRRRGNRLEKRARSAVREGKIRPLRDVMAKVRQRSNAEVLDVDLHKLPDGWIYALRLLTLKGRIRDVFLDATTLEVLHIEKKISSQDGVPLPPALQKKPNPIPLP